MLVLPASLTHAEAEPCLNMLRTALRADKQAIVQVDASALARFDSSALAVLLECRREALHEGKGFTVSGLAPRLRELAGLYGIAGLLPEPVSAPPGVASDG